MQDAGGARLACASQSTSKKLGGGAPCAGQIHGALATTFKSRPLRSSRGGSSGDARPHDGPEAACRQIEVDAGEDAAPWLRVTADELEERLLKRLDESYAAALARLADLGHSEEASLEAVLRAGHCYGKQIDAVSNIVANARTYLSDPGHAGGKGGFADLRRLRREGSGAREEGAQI